MCSSRVEWAGYTVKLHCNNAHTHSAPPPRESLGTVAKPPQYLCNPKATTRLQLSRPGAAQRSWGALRPAPWLSTPLLLKLHAR